MAIFLDYLRCDIVNILVPTPHKSQTKANTVNRASREHQVGCVAGLWSTHSILPRRLARCEVVGGSRSDRGRGCGEAPAPRLIVKVYASTAVELPSGWLRHCHIGSKWAAFRHCLIDCRSFSFLLLLSLSPIAALARGSFTSAGRMDGASAQAQILEAMTLVARGRATTSGAPTFAA